MLADEPEETLNMLRNLYNRINIGTIERYFCLLYIKMCRIKKGVKIKPAKCVSTAIINEIKDK